MGVSTTSHHDDATVLLKLNGTTIQSWTDRISPDCPFTGSVESAVPVDWAALTVRVLHAGAELVLERTGLQDEAAERFAKAARGKAWAHPAYLALAGSLHAADPRRR